MSAERPAPTARELDVAEDDLEWWHCSRESALGVHGSGFEGSGAAAWDDAAIWRLFDGLYSPQRRKAARRYFAVSPIVGELEAEHRETARAIYEPRAYPECLKAAFHCDRKAAGVVTLAGAALRSGALRSAYERAHGGNRADSTERLVRWLRDEAVTIAKRPPWLEAAQAEAREMRLGLLTAYAVIRRVYREALRKSLDGMVAEMRGSLA